MDVFLWIILILAAGFGILFPVAIILDIVLGISGGGWTPGDR